MKIKSIHVKNLFSFDDFRITFEEDNVITIFGSNNAGKTNLFRVLKLLKNIINSRVSSKDIETYLFDKNKKMAEITVDVVFNDMDRDIIFKFFKVFFKINSPKLVELCDCLGINAIENITSYFSEGVYAWRCTESYCEEPYFLLRLRNLEKDLENLINYLKNKDLDEITADEIDHSEVFHEFNHDLEVIKDINDLKNIIVSSINALLLNYKKSNYLHFSTLIGRKEAISQLIDEKYDLIKEFTEGLEKYIKYLKNLKMDENILKIFITLVTLNEILIDKMSIDVNKVFEYIRVNPWDKDIIEDLREILEFCEVKNNNRISLNYLLLKVYENNLICYECGYVEELKLGIPNSKFDEVIKCLFESKYKEENNIKTIDTFKEVMKILKKFDEDKLDLKIFSENWIATYLFYLKNNSNLNLRKRFEKIKEMFEYIFKDENLTFDVVLTNNIPNIAIYSRDFEVYLNMAGLSIKKILEILTLIFGYEWKIILLETPFEHIHPKFQKKLVEILKNQHIKSQIFIITYSPYFINKISIENTFRFYKSKKKKSTRFIKIKDIIDKVCNKDSNIDTYVRKIFLSDMTILVSPNVLNLSVIDLKECSKAPVDEYLVEIMYLKNENTYKQYLSLLGLAKIPYILIFSEWGAYSLFKKEILREEDGIKVRYKLLSDDEYPEEMRTYMKFFENKHPFWLSKDEFKSVINEYVKIIENHRKKLKMDGYTTLSRYEDVVKYCIAPLRKKLDDMLREKLFIFTCPESLELRLTVKDTDETKFLSTYLSYKKSKIEKFKEFFEYFVKFHNL